MMRWISLALLCLSIAPAFAADTESAPDNSRQWQVYAGCAAAYQANWQHRLTEPSRSRDMSAMIHDQSEECKKAATGFYESAEKASHDDASRNVAAYVETNVSRFLAMDVAGALEAYLDQCPQ